MSLQVKRLGSVSLPYPWILGGSTQALPSFHQIFICWTVGQITLTAAVQIANTSSSHHMVDFSQLIESTEPLFPTLLTTTGV
tara:strand:- start:258 stop:503 length:246 start_codon:yes stop_codon:yes gene_type:complete